MNGHRVTFIGGTLDGFQRVYDTRPNERLQHAVMGLGARAQFFGSDPVGGYRREVEVPIVTENYRVYTLPGGTAGEEIYVATLDGESAVPERKAAEAEDEICCANCGCNPATGQPYDPEPNALVDPYAPGVGVAVPSDR